MIYLLAIALLLVVWWLVGFEAAFLVGLEILALIVAVVLAVTWLVDDEDMWRDE